MINARFPMPKGFSSSNSIGAVLMLCRARKQVWLKHLDFDTAASRKIPGVLETLKKMVTSLLWTTLGSTKHPLKLSFLRESPLVSTGIWLGSETSGSSSIVDWGFRDNSLGLPEDTRG